MSIEIVEAFSSGNENYAGNDGDIERVYNVFDADDGIQARNAVLAYVPEIDLETSLVRKTIATVRKGYRIYECKVKYSKIENQVKMQIDCSTARAKVTKSLEDISNFKIRDLEAFQTTLDGPIDANVTIITLNETNANLYDPPFQIVIDDEFMTVTDLLGGSDIEVARGANNTTATSHLDSATTYILEPGPSFGGLINVGKDKVEGVDWHIPAMKLTMQWSSKWGTLDPDYVTFVEGAGGKVNDATLALTIKGQQYTFLRGELVCLGGTFEDTSDSGANISLKFDVSRSASIAIGERDDTNSTWRSKIYKEGWHFGWVRTTTRTSNGIQIDVPNSFHIQRVADYLDFDGFGIFDTIVDEEE